MPHSTAAVASARTRWTAVALLGLFGALPLTPSIAAESSRIAVEAGASPMATAELGGELIVHPNPDLFERLGLLPAPTKAGAWRLPLHAAVPLRIELADGAPTRVLSGAVKVPALVLRRRDGERSPALSLVPVPASALGWRLVDDGGAVWLTIEHAMRSPDMMSEGLRLITADLRVGAALAAWTGADAPGEILGNVSLRMPLTLPDTLRPMHAKSCDAPNWPGTPGYEADVILTNIDRVDVMRCRRADVKSVACDGPGGVEGLVVIVPSATLRNSSDADAADIPWYTKFTGNRDPYGNDQHPFLVWNLYRIDAAGRLEQIARSGLKHAFATANTNCHIEAAGCPGESHILGRGCEDLYNAASNDYVYALAPRTELIPSSGRWGRCGSVFDDGLNANGTGIPGCDGIGDDPPQDDLLRYRLTARETTIDPALNPGARYFMDAWYVVRDDVDIFNTMGSREIFPAWLAGASPRWTTGSPGPFTSGAVIDRWLAAAPEGTYTERVDVSTPEGKVAVAVRVVREPDGRYRYDYAVMNFDFARVVTAGADPDLQITDNKGLSGFALIVPGTPMIEDASSSDGDADAGNDWTLSTPSGEVRWSAPSGATLDWAGLHSFRFYSHSPPRPGSVQLPIALAGTPSSVQATIPVPDGNVLFENGFE